jgi:hypothetical protein
MKSNRKNTVTMTDFMDELSTYLQDFRTGELEDVISKFISLDDAAKLWGTDTTFVRRLESGHDHQLPLVRFIQICEAYDLLPSEVLAKMGK